MTYYLYNTHTSHVLKTRVLTSAEAQALNNELRLVASLYRWITETAHDWTIC